MKLSAALRAFIKSGHIFQRGEETFFTPPPLLFTPSKGGMDVVDLGFNVDVQKGDAITISIVLGPTFHSFTLTEEQFYALNSKLNAPSSSGLSSEHSEDGQ